MKTSLLKTCCVAVIVGVGGSVASALTVGSLSNFDAVNDTGGETEGFEIELEGIHSSDVYGTFGGSYSRYGNPVKEDTPTGVIVRWTAKWDPINQVFDTATPVAAPNINPGGHDCYNGGPVGNYLSSGCEHFGVSLGKAQSGTTYRWLVADPANPGQLLNGGNVPIPAPIFSVVPNPVPGNPPAVQAVFEAPREDFDQRKFADAYWAKMIKTKAHAQDDIQLDDLLLGRRGDPEHDRLFELEDEDDEVEIEWFIVQDRLNGDPGENEIAQEMQAGGNDRGVAYRFEFYEYTGQYEAEEHEVLCGGDGGCDLPLDGELGAYIGAQMAGVNLFAEPVLAGDFNGSGTLDSDDIDILSEQVRIHSEDLGFDLNEDAVVDDDDRVFWVHDLMNTWIGDADLNLVFDSNDLIAVLAENEYEDDIDGNSVWSSGDWDGDGDFSSEDLITALADSGYEAGPRLAAQAVPEVTHFGLLLLMLTGLSMRLRR